MTYITLSFEVHQPFRLKKNIPLNSPDFSNFFDDQKNKEIFLRVANKCYKKAGSIILELLDKYKEFKVNFSFSGTVIEQAEMYDKDTFEIFVQIMQHKQVEVLAETYYHSLVSLFEDKEEFIEQVIESKNLIRSLSKKEPKTFVNTEMIFNNIIAKEVENLGFEAIVTEGAERILQWRSPNFVYTRISFGENDKPFNKRIKIFLRNYRLSDDIAFRFGSRDWSEWPLTADKYAAWLAATPGKIINIYIDFETFGEHYWEESGIFWFLKALPYEILKYEHLKFVNFKDVIDKIEPIAEFDVFEFSTISWADVSKDVSAWLGNELQFKIFNLLKELKEDLKENENEKLKKLYKYLTQSDLLYYLSLKGYPDGAVHNYFRGHESPFEIFSNYLTALISLKAEIEKEKEIAKKLREIMEVERIKKGLKRKGLKI